MLLTRLFFPRLYVLLSEVRILNWNIQHGITYTDVSILRDVAVCTAA